MTQDSPKEVAPATEVVVELYEAHKKIQVKSVTGVFANWRWAFVWFTQILFYGLPWLPWGDRQSVLFDLAQRKFYMFGLVFWPQDVFFLAVLLIISAYALFLFTAVAGRLWCGYACPQTVYTEIFMWIEEKIEGDRNARIKLDKSPMTSEKLIKRTLKYGTWVVLSIWTGFTFVGYFTPIKELAHEAMTLSFGSWEWAWIIIYSTATYGFAGHLREQVCKYMCPYARFQGVMFDPDTLIITYDPEMGEPRGKRKKGVDYKAQGLGRCIDCDQCVVVCPTGIDIRNGLQYECIGCAACIDACDQVMERMSYPKGLIRYSTENAMLKRWTGKEIMRHVFRPRIFVYTAVLLAISVAWVWGLATKPELRVNIMRDRMTLAREADDGSIENVFRMQLMNISEHAQKYTFSVSGLNGITLVGEPVIEVPAASNKAATFEVRVPQGVAPKGSHVIYFDVMSNMDPNVSVHEKATFLMP